jgi:hypothetical protein
MKKLLTAVAMVLAIQSSVTANAFTLSSGLTASQVEQAMLIASAMCKVDGKSPSPAINKNRAKEMADAIPPEIKGDKAKVNDLAVLMFQIYIGCMLTHL